MNLRKNKLGVELAVSTVVMLIIGVILFGLGLSLFSKFSESGEKTIDDLRNEVKEDISKLECSSDEWICSPSIDIGLGDSHNGVVYLTNKGDTSKEYRIEIDSSTMEYTDDGNGYDVYTKDGCGSIRILYLKDETTIRSGSSNGVPFSVYTNKVSDECSFTLVAKLFESSSSQEVDRTPIIINVEK